MPKYTYPIVFILNTETELFDGYIPDLAIVGYGANPEEVFREMEDVLKNYLEIAIKYNSEIPEPSSLETITKKWPGFKVSLIGADVEAK